METTKVFSDLLAAYVDPSVRVIALKGSTRSSKTWSALQLLNTIGARSKKPRLISVVSETMPHLKRGAIRDFKNMLEGENAYNVNAWHDTDKIYSYNKGRIEFFSADQAGKVLGPARDILYMNEAINMSWEVYRQLAVRTTEKIILDYNPAFEFWVDSKLAPRADVRIIHSTYLDNDMLTAAQVAEIESNRDIDPEWWRVYGLGLTGSAEGLVVKNWDIVAGLPPRSEWRQAYIGIDFGWSAPSAIMLVVLSQGEVWIDQLGYGPGMDNPDIATCILTSGYGELETICDGAEPKSIKELQNAGVNAVATNNKDIQLGIRVMNRYKKHYTQRSVDSIDENRKYRYPQLPTGGYGGIPIKAFGHAKDAERYVFLNKLSNIASGFDVTVGSASRR
jgi:phage terminase large subunit